MIFYKTSSFGNDFIEIDENDLPAHAADKCLLAREICDSHLAVGADGVVFYCPCRQAGVPLGDRARGHEFNFQIYNRDGGEAELSGNGMAGLAAVLFQRRLASSPLILHTKSGKRHITLLDRVGPVFQLEVEIGQADFINRQAFPFLKDKQDSYVIDGLKFYPVSMGNPHAVILCRDEPAAEMLPALGKKIESHPMFPQRVNVEFVYFSDAENPIDGTAALGPASCRVFFYERGVGPTLASSTGSAAVFAVLRRLGMVKDRLLIDCGADKIAITWKQGIFIHNFTRLICRGNYFG
jgi:diaminopimelate epimerase